MLTLHYMPNTSSALHLHPTLFPLTFCTNLYSPFFIPIYLSTSQSTFPLTKLARPRSASLALISSVVRPLGIPRTIILACVYLLPSLRSSSVGDLS